MFYSVKQALTKIMQSLWSSTLLLMLVAKEVVPFLALLTTSKNTSILYIS